MTPVGTLNGSCPQIETLSHFLGRLGNGMNDAGKPTPNGALDLFIVVQKLRIKVIGVACSKR